MPTFLTGGSYLSLLAAMAIENAGVPLPSEIILPSAGYLVLTGSFSFWPAVTVAVLGGLLGSWLAYALANWGGRTLVLRFGGRFGLEAGSLAKAEKWFSRYGDATVFFGRLLPIIRTYISFPAGLATMPPVRFSLFTVLGSLPWTVALIYAGLVLGRHLNQLTSSFHLLDALVAAASVAVAIIWWKRR